MGVGRIGGQAAQALAQVDAHGYDLIAQPVDELHPRRALPVLR